MASTTVLFPSIAAGQQQHHLRERNSLQPPPPPSSPSSRFSLADFPMPPPLQRPYSQPNPGYWQKLIASSTYAIRRKTFNGEGRTSNGGIERGDFTLSDDEEEEMQSDGDEDEFCMVKSQRTRAVTMNPAMGQGASHTPVESVTLSPEFPSESFRTRPRSEGPQPTNNDLELVVPMRFSSLSTTSSRGHAKSRKNMHKAQKQSTASTGSGSSGAASTIRAGSTRTLRRVPSVASTIRMGGLSPTSPIPPPPPIPSSEDRLQPVVTPRRSSLPKRAIRKSLRSTKSVESSSRGH